MLLRRLESTIGPNDVARAYADDIAMVIQDFRTTAAGIAVAFDEFARISALSLNISKTVFIPLWPHTSNSMVHTLIRENCPSWNGIHIDSKGKLLGIYIGPGADDMSWSKPLRKFQERALLWAAKKLGLHFNTMAFNVFIVTVLEFVAQLCVPSTEVIDAVSAALRLLAPGPGTWCIQQDLEHLQDFAFQFHFRTLVATARAAKFRVSTQCLPDLKRMDLELRGLRAASVNRPFGEWHDKSFVTVLQQNNDELLRIGAVDKYRRLMHITSDTTAIQARMREAIASLDSKYQVMERIRHKFARWQLAILPGHIPARVLRTLHLIGGRCRPCVLAMLFRTMWNGWPTTARMKQREGLCVLGCPNALDRIEHYAVCPATWSYLSLPAPAGLGLDRRLRCIDAFLCIASGMSDQEKVQMATAVYAVARTVHQCRLAPDTQPRPLLRLHANFGRRRGALLLTVGHQLHLMFSFGCFHPVSPLPVVFAFL